MVRRVVVLGTGGTSVDIVDTLMDLNDADGTEHYECFGYLDDNPATHGQRLLNVPVLGPFAAAADLPDCWFVNGIGSPASFRLKPDLLARAGIPDDRYLTLVHPSAVVSRHATLGPGTVILQNATVTANAALGRHVVVLPNSVVSHDVVVGDYSCIAGGVCLSGGVEIGRSCYLGTRCAVIENARVGAGTLIAMGSVVRSDVPDNVLAAGNPATVKRRLDEAVW